MSLDYALEVLRGLVGHDTNSLTKRDYLPCAERIAEEAKALGLKAVILETKDEKGRRCPSVLASKNINAKRTILISSHFDVVPPGELRLWNTNPFQAVQRGKRIYGRGVSDDKLGIACALAALKELLEKGGLRKNIKLLFSCDEEIGSNYGLGWVSKAHGEKISSDCALIIDSSLDHVSCASSGVVLGEIVLEGVQGHAGYPFKFPNVVHKSIPFLQELLKIKEKREKVESFVQAPPGSPRKKLWGRFSITVLRAGEKTNVIPGSLSIGFDARCVPEEEVSKVIAQLSLEIKAMLKRHGLKGKVKMEGHSGHLSKAPEWFVKEVVEAASKAFKKRVPVTGDLGGTDAPFLENIGIPTLGFGPINEKSNYHGINEHVEIRDVERMIEFLKHLLSKE